MGQNIEERKKWKKEQKVLTGRNRSGKERETKSGVKGRGRSDEEKGWVIKPKEK